MSKRFMFLGVCAAAILLIAPNKGNAQFTVDYFGAADQTYEFVNFGLQGASETAFFPIGWLCADIYVYSSQELVACGGCEISPNGSISVDLNANLRSNPLTGVVPTRGVIKVVYTPISFSSFGSCNPTAVTPVPGLKTFRAKGTSDVELAEVPLSASEQARLDLDCSAVAFVGSGSGRISCGASDPR